MQLLDAVNYVLPKLGEHQVTSLDARSPTLRILLQLFEYHRQSVLRRGWWFNEGVHTLQLNPDSEIDVGTNVLSISSTSGSNVARRGARLFNIETQTYKFDAPVEVRVISDLDWELLPSAVQDWIKYSVLLDQLITDQGVTQELQVWEEARATAERQTLAEHLRARKYNTANSRRGQRIISAIRGRV